MKNKILVGSIIAVAILIGVSFTSVVGFQSVKSNAKASPLFTVRTQRAIDEKSRDLTCDYVGKGEATLITIPKRDDKTALVQKVIKNINQMDDETFGKYIASVINYAQRDGKLKDENLNEIKEAFHILRENGESISKLMFNINNKNAPTAETCYCITQHYPLICILLSLYILFTILVATLGFIIENIISYMRMTNC